MSDNEDTLAKQMANKAEAAHMYLSRMMSADEARKRTREVNRKGRHLLAREMEAVEEAIQGGRDWCHVVHNVADDVDSKTLHLHSLGYTAVSWGTGSRRYMRISWGRPYLNASWTPYDTQT